MFDNRIFSTGSAAIPRRKMKPLFEPIKTGASTSDQMTGPKGVLVRSISGGSVELFGWSVHCPFTYKKNGLYLYQSKTNCELFMLAQRTAGDPGWADIGTIEAYLYATGPTKPVANPNSLVGKHLSPSKIPLGCVVKDEHGLVTLVCRSSHDSTVGRRENGTECFYFHSIESYTVEVIDDKNAPDRVRNSSGQTTQSRASLVGKKMRPKDVPIGAEFVKRNSGTGRSYMRMSDHKFIDMLERVSKRLHPDTGNCEIEIISDPVVEVGDEVRCERSSRDHAVFDNSLMTSGVVSSVGETFCGARDCVHIRSNVPGKSCTWPADSVSIIKKADPK